MTGLLLKYRSMISSVLMLILYGVGLVGLQTSSKDWFLAATPLTLGMTLALLLLNHRDWTSGFIVFALSTAILGFGIEVLGVKTGLIFGAYAYGETLGWKVLDVPLMIAGNWLLLTYAAGSVLARLRWHWSAKALAGASLLCLLDVLIEPVAVAFDFWHWEGGAIPLRNYLAWWLVAALMLSLFFLLKFEKHNKVAPAVLGLQVAFFGILFLMLI